MKINYVYEFWKFVFYKILWMDKIRSTKIYNSIASTFFLVVLQSLCYIESNGPYSILLAYIIVYRLLVFHRNTRYITMYK